MELLGHWGIAITLNACAHVLPALLRWAFDGMDDFSAALPRGSRQDCRKRLPSGRKNSNDLGVCSGHLPRVSRGTRASEPQNARIVIGHRARLRNAPSAASRGLGPLATGVPRVRPLRRARRAHESDLPPIHAP